jgi:hypothetical protein
MYPFFTVAGNSQLAEYEHYTHAQPPFRPLLRTHTSLFAYLSVPNAERSQSCDLRVLSKCQNEAVG